MIPTHPDDFPCSCSSERTIEQLRAQVEELRMKAGRKQTQCAVLMQAMAWFARNGFQTQAQEWVERADRAAIDVRPEDFVVAKVR